MNDVDELRKILAKAIDELKRASDFADSNEMPATAVVLQELAGVVRFVGAGERVRRLFEPGRST